MPNSIRCPHCHAVITLTPVATADDDKLLPGVKMLDMRGWAPPIGGIGTDIQQPGDGPFPVVSNASADFNDGTLVQGGGISGMDGPPEVPGPAKDTSGEGSQS
ncbi:hypothetical protein [Fimbriiglobus ruber]|uniref:Uncharacterized protein n=1 Tax=Fimbriiglobus ruber TaxID=1908690 RepID=A0A225DDR1_9BACT|nr:hypothetical protein [Fimbriiglobus ruber]OWK34257.1 hypothetical protein FRUB_10228 [Fimbriiglobus ruber]